MINNNTNWEENFREYFDRTLKPKKPTMGGLDRELCVDFISKVLNSQLIELKEEVEKEKMDDPRKNSRHSCLPWNECQACVEDYNINKGLDQAISIIDSKIKSNNK